MDSAFLLLANFCQVPTWKIWFRHTGRIFHEKNGPKFARRRIFFSTNRQILLLVPIGSQKYRKIFVFSYFHISTCSQKYRIVLIFSYFHISTCGQIWPNHFQDDSPLGYITKLKKETLHGLVNEIICKPPLALTMKDKHKICYPTFLG